MRNRLIILASIIMMAVAANAQLIRTDDLEKYAKERYGEKWTEAAENLVSTLTLDKNNSLTYIQVIDCKNQTKDQLYVLLNYWATASFNDAKSVIQLNDKELGCIIVQAYLSNVASHVGGINTYEISVKPIIKIDIKDGKIRVTYTVQNYDAFIISGGGIMGAMGGTVPVTVEEKWALDGCFPFVPKDKHKKTSAKALIMTHAFSNVIMDKIEEAVKNGLVGNENDNW